MSIAEYFRGGFTPYSRENGPVAPEALTGDVIFDSTNCQRAVQIILFQMGILVSPKTALSREGYLGIGDNPSEVIFDNLNGNVFLKEVSTQLKPGDVIYAEARIGNGRHPKGSDEWAKHLHQAVYAGYPTNPATLRFFPGIEGYPAMPYVIHATQPRNPSTPHGLCFWDAITFDRYYSLVRVRRISPYESS